MKNNNHLLASTSSRVLIYLSVFIVGSAIHEFIFRTITPTIWSDGAIVLALLTSVIFTLVGILLASGQPAISRVTAAATLFILSFIALRVGHSAAPDPYLLAAAFCIAAIGAQPALHRKPASPNKTIMYSFLIILISAVTIVVFIYGMTMLDRIDALATIRL